MLQDKGAMVLGLGRDMSEATESWQLSAGPLAASATALEEYHLAALHREPEQVN